MHQNFDDMNRPNKKVRYRKDKLHLVIICDETGVFDAFRIIKEHLGGNGETYISVVYSVPDNFLNPLYEREFAILETRFSHHLFKCTLIVEPGNYESVQEFIEAIINSNTSAKMEFIALGNLEFVSCISGVLKYLDVDEHKVESKTY